MTTRDARLRAQIGAYSLHAQYDSRDLTANARRTFLERFDRDVDPANVLDPAERQRRSAAARSAYFRNLARLSAKARRRTADTAATPPRKVQRPQGVLPASEHTLGPSHSEHAARNHGTTER